MGPAVVLTARTECTDRMVIAGERHLRVVLEEYAINYSSGRPHRSLDLRAVDDDPDVITLPVPLGRIRRHQILGGLISQVRTGRIATGEVTRRAAGLPLSPNT